MNPVNYRGVIVVMGVAGCGKSLIGRQLADKLRAPLCEADELHPPRNIELMSTGTPLTDEDRAPWLSLVAAEAQKYCETDGKCIVACSALRKKYRDRLRQAHRSVYFVHLAGTKELIHERMRQRKGHFMPVTLLDSQFDTLEPPTGEPKVITVDIDSPPQSIVDSIISKLTP